MENEEFAGMSPETARRRSNAWFLLPVFLQLVGGVIAYFVLRGDDPPRARNCLFLGIALTAVMFATGALIGAEISTIMGDPFTD